MIRTPPASWEPPAGVHPNTAASPRASTSSPAHWARPWAAAAAATLPRAAKSSSGCGSGRVPTSSPTAFPPGVAPASLAVLELLEHTPQLRAQLFENTRLFRAGLTQAGFDLRPGEHPIIPVMLGDAALAGRMADRLLERGVYVIGFSYPVVPKGQARIRTQMSAALTREQLERAVDAFTSVGRELGVLG